MRLSWKQQANRERIHLNFSPYRSTDLLTAAGADARDFTGGRRLQKAMGMRLRGTGRSFTDGPKEMETGHQVQTRVSARRPRYFSTRRTTNTGPTAGRLFYDEIRAGGFIVFFPPTHNLDRLFPLMQILQPRPDPAYVLRHSGARRADRTCNSYSFEGITLQGLASNTNVETTNFEKRICC